LSRRAAARCIKSGRRVGVRVLPFAAIPKTEAARECTAAGLELAWFESQASDPYAVIGCFLSHYYLWRRCLAARRPILVLEHDAVFSQPVPEVPHNGLLNIGRPSWMSGLETDWYELEPEGVRPYCFTQFRGAFAYLLTPERADHLIDLAKTQGIWPVDEFINRRTSPFIEMLKPALVAHHGFFSSIQKAGLWIDGGPCQDDVWRHYGAVPQADGAP